MRRYSADAAAWPAHRGFTLVDLTVSVLVVSVSVSALLLGIDAARDLTREGVCAGKLSMIASAAVQYAVENSNQYATRPPNGQNGANWSPRQLRMGHVLRDWGLDWRPQLHARFRPLNGSLNDPNVEPVDLQIATSMINSDTYIYGSYNLWFGWRYVGPTAERGMYRLGDRFTWAGQSFGVLATDDDLISLSENTASSSHPDSPAAMAPVRFNGQGLFDLKVPVSTSPAPGAAASGDAGIPVPLFRYVISEWRTNGRSPRGALDLNYVYDDGSVRRLEQIATHDERMARVPTVSHASSYPARYIQLPREP